MSGGSRVITTNDLPRRPHDRRVPGAAVDPPTSTTATRTRSSRSRSPTRSMRLRLSSTKSSCLGGEVGVMTTGVALFDAFDAGGRDAGAWEVRTAATAIRR